MNAPFKTGSICRILISLCILVSFVFVTKEVAANRFADSIKQLLKNQSLTERSRYHLYEELVGYYLSEKGQFDSIGYYSQQMLRISKKLGNDSLQCAAYNAVSNYYMHKGNYKQALLYLLTGMHLAEDIRYRFYICSFYSDASIIYNSLENYSEAMDYLRRARTYIPEKEPEKSFLSAQVYANLAITFVKQKKADSALRYIQYANEFILHVNSPFGKAYILHVFGNVYQELKNYDFAEKYYKSSLQICEKEDIDYLLPIVAQEYGQLLLEEKKYREALLYGLLSMSKAIVSEKNERIIKSAEILRKTYAFYKNYDSAYYYANLQLLYRDSLYSQKALNELNDLTFVEELLNSEKKINAQKAAENRKHLMQLVVSGAFIFLFIVLFFLFSHSIIANIRLIEILGVIGLLLIFEFINLLIHPFLMDVTNDSPFWMLLALVVIAAVLVPAHHFLEQWIKHKLVEKNKRIKLMAARKVLEELGDSFSESTGGNAT